MSGFGGNSENYEVCLAACDYTKGDEHQATAVWNSDQHNNGFPIGRGLSTAHDIAVDRLLAELSILQCLLHSIDN